MGKFDGIVIFSDIDGTLGLGGVVSPENCQAIRYFQENGGKFSVASGRAPRFISTLMPYFEANTWCASMNGAVLCSMDGKTRVFDSPSDQGLLNLTRKIFNACPEIIDVRFGPFGQERIFPGGAELPDERLLELSFYNAVFHIPTDKSDDCMARIKKLAEPDYIVMRSWIEGIEVQPRGTGKGDAVHKLKRLLGEDARTVIGVGNYENDIDLIREADIGYAVGDAIESVKAIADRITVNCADHAIAAIVADLDRACASIERSTIGES